MKVTNNTQVALQIITDGSTLILGSGHEAEIVSGDIEIFPVIDWRAVESSNVTHVAHCAGDMYVRFKGGSEYVYLEVPIEVYEMVLASESIGRAINSMIKPKYTVEVV